MLIVVIPIINFVIFQKFQEQEDKQITIDANLALSALRNEISDLDRFTNGYATRDDTYQFITNNNTQYIKSNIQAETFRHSNINLMAYVDIQGQLIYGIAYDTQTDSLIALPQDFTQAIASNETLWGFNSPSQHLSGVIEFDNNLVIIASRPILTSNGEGPIHGAVIFARPISAELVDRLNNVHESLQPMQASMNVSIFSTLYTNTNPSDVSSLNISTTDNGITIKRFNQTTVAGYKIENSIYDEPLLILRVVAARDIYSEGERTVLLLTVVGVIWSMIIGLATILLFNFSVVKRISRLTAGLASIGQHKSLKMRLETPDSSKLSNDEISSLTKSINGMLDMLESSAEELNRAQRLASIGELAGQLGHDLRNPLAGIKNGIYLIRKKNGQMEEAKRDQIYTCIENAIEDANRIINSLVDYSSNFYLHPQPCMLRPLTQKVLSNLKIPEHIGIDNACFDDTQLFAVPEMIEKVLVNLIQNAIDAIPNTGTIKISARQNGSNTEISIADSGIGIPYSIKDKLFSPLVTTKAKGMGMGLAICKRIIDVHGGQIIAQSEIGKGSTFTFCLPNTKTIVQP